MIGEATGGVSFDWGSGPGIEGPTREQTGGAAARPTCHPPLCALGVLQGKLRMLYECFPMAMLMEQAGGKATSGTQRIMDIVPDSIHGRWVGGGRPACRGRLGRAVLAWQVCCARVYRGQAPAQTCLCASLAVPLRPFPTCHNGAGRPSTWAARRRWSCLRCSRKRRTQRRLPPSRCAAQALAPQCPS